MSRPLLIKAGAIVGLTLLLLVPLSLVSDLIGERRGLRDRVVQEVAQSSTGVQRLDGIALIVPCTETYSETETLESGRSVTRTRTRACDLMLLPERMALAGAIETDFRYRGIYRVLAYRTQLRIEGEFKIAAVAPPPAGVSRAWEPPRLVVGIGEIRGIRSTPRLAWNDNAVSFDAGTGKAPWARGIQAAVTMDPARDATLPFALTLDLAGMERLEVVPAAGQVEIRLRSAWPHPSFVGRYLPETRAVGAEGFDALWRTSDLGTNVRQAFQRCVQGKCDDYAANALGVTFLQTVDVYQQAYRAARYGVLFVLLTFSAFFLYEVLRGLRVHPVQYGLVGAALAIFFVLLIALSEHIAFARAYAIAAAACIGLIGVYVRFVLGGWMRAATLCGLLASLYGAMFMVLGSEDYALLMGAVLMFAALAAFMLLTRHLDWYGVTVRSGREQSLPAEANG